MRVHARPHVCQPPQGLTHRLRLRAPKAAQRLLRTPNATTAVMTPLRNDPCGATAVDVQMQARTWTRWWR